MADVDYKVRNNEDFERLDSLVQQYRNDIDPVIDIIVRQPAHYLHEGDDIHKDRVKATLAYETQRSLEELPCTPGFTPERKSRAISTFNAIKNVVDTIFERNQRLAYTVLKTRIGLLDRKEAEQTAQIGMFKAILNYDRAVGTQFSTYAMFWIRKTTVYDGSTQLHGSSKSRLRAKEICAMGSLYDDEEIMSMMGIDGFQLHDLRTLSKRIISLSEPNKQTELPLEDAVGVAAPEFEYLESRDQVEKALEQLTDKERSVMIRRFGLDDNNEETLESIAVSMGVTKERVRQLENKILQKLKRRIRSSTIRRYSWQTPR